MAAKPVVHSTFQVTSGCLCYGGLSAILHGASMDKQPFPTKVKQSRGGTITSQILKYNTVAENGKWNVYQMKDKTSGLVNAWFACHSSVEPENEVQQIIRVSGSPYERDCGSIFNDKSTFNEAVLVINRYDWSGYHPRYKDQVHLNHELDLEPRHVAIGLVDRDGAGEAVESWAQTGSQDRENIPGGVWMHIPLFEYQFARFGFDSDRTAARSFLFFTIDTAFAFTTFDGVHQTLREPDEDQSGVDLPAPYRVPPHDMGEGTVWLKEEIAPVIEDNPAILPAENEYFGPYGTDESVFNGTDIEAIRGLHGVEREFQNKRREQSYRCVNEMIMGYLERAVVPVIKSQNPTAKAVGIAATALFPNHDAEHSLDKLTYDAMLKPDEIFKKFPTKDIDQKGTGNRIKSFLSKRSPGRSNKKSIIQDKDFIRGLVAVVVLLLAEILELADKGVAPSSRTRIFPLDIRKAVYYDQELLGQLKYSKHYWQGDHEG